MCLGWIIIAVENLPNFVSTINWSRAFPAERRGKFDFPPQPESSESAEFGVRWLVGSKISKTGFLQQLGLPFSRFTFSLSALTKGNITKHNINYSQPYCSFDRGREFQLGFARHEKGRLLHASNLARLLVCSSNMCNCLCLLDWFEA